MAATRVAETFRPLASSHIAQFSYDPETLDLTVEFVGGDSGVYADVPPELYNRWTAEGGSGKFWYWNIKDVFDWTPD